MNIALILESPSFLSWILLNALSPQLNKYLLEGCDSKKMLSVASVSAVGDDSARATHLIEFTIVRPASGT